MEEKYTWVDDPTESGVSVCDTDVLNDCLMHLKYENKRGDSLPLFTTMAFDHVLSGDESIGWLLQGSLVTKLYPDAYERIIEEYYTGIEVTVRGIPCRIALNGHIICDIMQKEAVDALYASSGVADFYVFDLENEQFYLPRNDYFAQFTRDVSKVNQFKEAGLPNITGNFDNGFRFIIGSTSGAFSKSTAVYSDWGGVGSVRGASGALFNASYSNPIYGKSSTVQPPASLKLVYYKVGNTVINESLIDVAQVLSDLALKADMGLGNISDGAKSLVSGLGMPSTRYDKLTLKASGSRYISPGNGYFWFYSANPGCTASIRGSYIGMKGKSEAGYGCEIFIPIKKGQEVQVNYSTMELSEFKFIYAEGAKND